MRQSCCLRPRPSPERVAFFEKLDIYRHNLLGSISRSEPSRWTLEVVKSSAQDSTDFCAFNSV
jgi:hypothetical protein